MPLAPEFDRKLQQQAQQFQKQSNPQKGPREHPEDTLIVRNILVGTDIEVEEVIPYANARPSVDPATGQQHFVNQIDTNIYEHSWNTRDFFEVRWDGRPHRIKPGETRRMPRYLAEHFAKHLIDFILIQREKKQDVTGLVKNRLEREKLYKEIIVGVDSYYNGDMWEYEREGTQVEHQVEQLNKPDNAVDLGLVPNTAMGYGLTDKEPEPIIDTPPIDLGDVIIPKTTEELMAKKTRQGLLKEAKTLGIELTGHETKETLFQMVSNF